jgi:ABC-type molybdate transport system substrate-binding protein
MRLLAACLLFLIVSVPARAQTATVAVDPGFAPVAVQLAEVFGQMTGHDVALAITAGQGAQQADVLLAADTELPARLAQTGQAEADTLLTYASGRDAVLLSQGLDNPVARAFLAFLITPEAWDVIVAHGFGAH